MGIHGGLWGVGSNLEDYQQSSQTPVDVGDETTYLGNGGVYCEWGMGLCNMNNS